MTNLEVWLRLYDKYNNPPFIEFWRDGYEDGIYYYTGIDIDEKSYKEYMPLREELLKSGAQVTRYAQDYGNVTKLVKEKFVFPNGGKITVNLK